MESGHLEDREGKHYLTAKGKELGGEFHMGAKFGAYFLWPENFKPKASGLMSMSFINPLF